jgi:hypothetical protein
MNMLEPATISTSGLQHPCWVLQCFFLVVMSLICKAIEKPILIS